MSVTYATAVKTARMQAVIDQIGTTGKLEIGTTGMASILRTISLNNPAGTVSGLVATLSGFPKTAGTGNAGTAAEARIRTGADADVITGLTVGVGSGDIQLDSLSIAATQDVTVNSATITHA